MRRKQPAIDGLAQQLLGAVRRLRGIPKQEEYDFGHGGVYDVDEEATKLPDAGATNLKQSSWMKHK